MAENIDRTPPEEPVSGPGAEPGAQPTGHPAQESAPRTVPLKYGGREYQAPEEMARAWAEREQEFTRRLNQQGQELGELRKLRQEWQQTRDAIAGPRPAAEPDLNTLWFENPAAAADRIKADLRKEYESRIEADRAAMVRAQSEQQFWADFRRDNDDLQEDEYLARALWDRHAPQWAQADPTMTLAAAREKLADTTRQEILRMARKVNTGSSERRPRMAEPASGDRPPRVAREPDEGPASISEAIRQMNARRRAAAKAG